MDPSEDGKDSILRENLIFEQRIQQLKDAIKGTLDSIKRKRNLSAEDEDEVEHRILKQKRKREEEEVLSLLEDNRKLRISLNGRIEFIVNGLVVNGLNRCKEVARGNLRFTNLWKELSSGIRGEEEGDPQADEDADAEDGAEVIQGLVLNLEKEVKTQSNENEMMGGSDGYSVSLPLTTTTNYPSLIKCKGCSTQFPSYSFDGGMIPSPEYYIHCIRECREYKAMGEYLIDSTTV